MNALKNLAATICILLAGVQTASAQVRNQQPANEGPPATEQQVRDEVRQLMTDLDDPNFDYSKVPPRIQQVFRDFRSLSQTMDPNQASQFRGEIFQQFGPVMQRHRDQIQHAMQMAFLNGLQEPLGCTDDEFQAIRPALEKVVDTIRQTVQMPRFGPPGGQQNNQNTQTLSRTEQTRQDLQTAIDDPNSNPDLIKTRLDDFRQAMAKSKQDLSVARDALRSLLTVRQEAVLVNYGLLD